MTQHSLYPDWVKLKYTSLGRTKHAILPCAISGAATPGLEPEFTLRANPPMGSTIAVSNYVAAISDMFAASDSFDSYEVYHKASIDGAPVFVYGATIGLPGTGGFADVPYSEAVFTFKTPEQGGLKLYLMETHQPVDIRYALPAAGHDDINSVVDFIMSDDNWILGRNNNQPLLPLFMTSKQNDFYRRKYKL